MNEIPDETLLTIIIILGGSISISQFFPCKNEIFENKFNVDRVSNVLIIFIIMYIIVVVFNLICIDSRFVDDVLVGLSALLATATAVKYINHEKELEKNETRRDLYDRRLDVYNSLNKFRNDLPTGEFEFNYINELQNKLISVEFIFENKIKSLTDELYQDLINLILLKKEEQEIGYNLKNGKPKLSYSSPPISTEENYQNVNKKWAELNLIIQKKIIKINDNIKVELKLI